MPPPELGGGYILADLFEVGPCNSGGMGPSRITDTDIAAYQMNTGVRFTPWESETLKHLSAVYVNALHDAKDKNAAPPWAPPASAESRDRVAEQMAALSKQMKPKKGI
jgi:hypothetical protein